jgi:hypothetical protein
MATTVKREMRAVLDSTRAINTRLPWRTYDGLERLAEQQGITRSAAIRLAVEAYLAAQGLLEPAGDD